MDFPILAFSSFFLNSSIVSVVLYNVENVIYIYKMEYENMRVPELKALARERGLRGYSRLGRLLCFRIILHHLHICLLGNLWMIGLDQIDSLAKSCWWSVETKAASA